MFLYSTVSTLKPMVGMVVTISPSFSLYRMVVLPAASRPTIRMRISFLPKRPLKRLAKMLPMLAICCAQDDFTLSTHKQTNCPSTVVQVEKERGGALCASVSKRGKKNTSTLALISGRIRLVQSRDLITAQSSRPKILAPENLPRLFLLSFYELVIDILLNKATTRIILSFYWCKWERTLKSPFEIPWSRLDWIRLGLITKSEDISGEPRNARAFFECPNKQTS